MRVPPDLRLNDAPPLEVLTHPGSQGTRACLGHPSRLEWAHQKRSTARSALLAYFQKVRGQSLAWNIQHETPYQSGTKGLAASVPAGASNLLLTTFPSLTDAQRTSILGQTEIASGFPLDQSGTTNGSWERLNLAAAMSAAVQLTATGGVTVVSTGGPVTVLPAPAIAHK